MIQITKVGGKLYYELYSIVSSAFWQDAFQVDLAWPL